MSGYGTRYGYPYGEEAGGGPSSAAMPEECLMQLGKTRYWEYEPVFLAIPQMRDKATGELIDDPSNPVVFYFTRLAYVWPGPAAAYHPLAPQVATWDATAKMWWVYLPAIDYANGAWTFVALQPTHTVVPEWGGWQWMDEETYRVGVIGMDVGNVGTAVDTLMQIMTNRWKVNVLDNTFTIYEGDGETELLVFDVKDETGALNARSIFERVPQDPEGGGGGG